MFCPIAVQHTVVVQRKEFGMFKRFRVEDLTGRPIDRISASSAWRSLYGEGVDLAPVARGSRVGVSVSCGAASPAASIYDSLRRDTKDGGRYVITEDQITARTLEREMVKHGCQAASIWVSNPVRAP